VYFIDKGIQGVAKEESREASNGKLDLELRRGVLVLAVLSQLRTAQYGYSLRQALAGAGMPIEEGTLYPLLRRLESLGLLVSEWRIEDGPPRRYYTLSPEGARHYQNLSASWAELVTTMNRLIANKK
jgi:DNA-binding PadR family transcriptional regulator